MHAIKKRDKDKDFNRSLESLGSMNLKSLLGQEYLEVFYDVLKKSNLNPDRFFRDLMASIKVQAKIFTEENSEKGIKPLFLRIHEHVYWDIGWGVDPYGSKRPTKQEAKETEERMTHYSNNPKGFFISDQAKKDMEKIRFPLLEQNEPRKEK